MDAIRVVTQDQVTDIKDYGKVINRQADIIERLSDLVDEMSERISKLESYNDREIRRKTFKKYVVIASNEECRLVLIEQFKSWCHHIINVNDSMRNVTYYRLSDNVLENGEIVFITSDFFGKWKLGKRYKAVTIEELRDILYS